MNETNVKVSFSNSVTNAKKLDTYAEKLKEIYGILSAIDKGQLAQLGDFNISLTKVKDNTQNLDKHTSKFAKNMNTAFNIGKMALFSKKIYGLGRGIAELTTKSSSYVENLNLLEVAYANINRKTGEFNEDIKVTSARIEKLISNMSEVYGLDESDLARTFGIFKQLANAMELPTQTAENLSELMVKMRQDIASLYNLDLDRAGNALQSALAGQVRPIRTATGADITEKTLQKTVDNLGLDTTINKLSFVEKRLIMVISLTNQLRNSQGDYGRTIESIANQTKVLHDQWERLTRAIGNVFNPLIKSILPVVNGVLMALTEIANIIASLLGFKLDEFDYSGLAGVSDYANDIIEGFDGAGASVDNLKKKLNGLRSFDKLNVITTPSNSGKSSGGVSSGINPKILEAFNSAFSNYDDMLGKVRMKANDIRDSIMKWLGFTKKINPLTGDIEWEYQGIGKTFSNLLKTFKDMSPLMKVITTGITVFAGVKVVNGVKNLGGMLANITGISKIMPALKSNTELFSKTAMDLWSENLTGTQKFTNALIGTGGLIISLDAVKGAMKEMAISGEISAGNVAQSFLGIAGSAGSLALALGSYFGPGGVIAGLIGGTFLGLIEAWGTYDTYVNTNLADIEKHEKEIKAQYEDLIKLNESLDEQYKVSDAHTTYYEALYTELQSIVDENGKIKTGYEDRAKVITNELADALGIEIEITDGVIKKYGELGDEIEELIKQKQAMAKLNALEKAHNEAVEKMPEARKKESEAYTDLLNAQTNLNNMLDKEAEKWGVSKESLENYYKTGKKNNELKQKWIGLSNYERQELDKNSLEYKKLMGVLEKAQNDYKLASDALEGYLKIEEDWVTMTGYATAKNYDAMNEYFDHTRNLYGMDAEKQKEYWQQNLTDNQRYLEDLERNRDKYSESQYESLKNRYNHEIELSNEKMEELRISMMKDVSEIDDDVVNHFINMGEKSTDKFIEQMSNLPKDMQTEIISKMKEKGHNISEEIQKGLNEVNLQKEIQVKAKMDEAKTKVNNLINSINNGLGKIMGITIPAIKFAKGGLPNIGQIFIANEKGPELVGNIGGQSFVANQNQMMDLLDKKIGNAQNNTRPQVINLYLDADHKIGSYTIEQLQNMAKTDGKPITIGG